jgi:hypothetical protein
LAGGEGRTVAPWAGALLTLLLGGLSGTAIPWAFLILLAALPGADSFLIFLAMLIPLFAFVCMIATFGFLAARYTSKFHASPLWPIGGGIAGVILQVYIFVEIFGNQE